MLMILHWIDIMSWHLVWTEDLALFEKSKASFNANTNFNADKKITIFKNEIISLFIYQTQISLLDKNETKLTQNKSYKDSIGLEKCFSNTCNNLKTE